MNKKYELMYQFKSDGILLYRICALRSFSDVKKGDIGGFVESEKNLSHDGNCWIYDSAKAIEHSRVHGDAKIHDHVLLKGIVRVYGCAQISGNCTISCGDISDIYYKRS